jgi:hypothetical protein
VEEVWYVGGGVVEEDVLWRRCTAANHPWHHLGRLFVPSSSVNTFDRSYADVGGAVGVLDDTHSIKTLKLNLGCPGSAIRHFSKPLVLQVPRFARERGRFLPIKSTSDLFLLQVT